MPPKYFPLRWECTGDEWCFASPIEWAAANGLYELIRELIRIDNNLLFKLTSLARTRRLDNAWDDGGRRFRRIARCRSSVARRLLRDFETLRGPDSLIRAGYGGWLVYTAAMAGDLDFVKELLGRDPLLAFGEGEYGATDVLYAASRGGSGEVFKAVLDCCLSAAVDRRGDVLPEDFRWEILNRAVHAAARGGNLEMLIELLGDGCNVLAYRDSQGSTVLHTAAGRGHVEVVKHLTSSYDIIASMDDRGNTALHVAAYRARLPVLEFLIAASPSLTSSTNIDGDNLLHSAIAGFRAHNFQSLHRHSELMKKLLGGTLLKICDLINAKNNDKRTPLHTAVIENIPSEIIDLMLSVLYVDLNARNCEGNTPLDLLCGRTRMVPVGGVSSEQKTRGTLVCLPGSHWIGSPGTSFKIRDAEIVVNKDTRRSSSVELTRMDDRENGYSNEIEDTSSPSRLLLSNHRRSGSASGGKGRLGNFLHLLGKKEMGSCGSSSMSSPVSLRQQYSRAPSLSMHRQGSMPGRFGYNKKLGAHEKSNLGSPSSAFSGSFWPPSPLSGEPMPSTNGSLGEIKVKPRRHSSFNMRSINNYLCMGSRSLAIEKAIQFQPEPEPEPEY